MPTKPKPNKRQPSKLEWLLAMQIIALGLPEPEREYRFCAERRYRADFAWPAYKLLVEVEGGIWTRGRHVRPKGFENDCEKYNLAALLGYRVLRFPERMIRTGGAVQVLEGVFAREKS